MQMQTSMQRRMSLKNHFYILHALDAFAAIYLFSITSLEAQS